ncbi:hypothetical protein Enr10x_04660 [Gimesia panareensis]|uniref:Uncharacterized protein n=1 Tax=Gimesia panareensis TaxID=2527978 RepID=A0A517Q0M5_9PLAN|nr:hypothetical protein [Gimesia panareensis]QDT25171.1 hypothetical protein Enr10x_04660 [Gimesia panareensis]
MEISKQQTLLDKAIKKRQAGNDLFSFEDVFTETYKVLEVPQQLLKVVHQMSLIGYQQKIDSLCPPCALPLWRTMSGVIVCEWRHWFCNREPVVARFYPEHGMALEWARNYTQLSYLIIQNILTAEAEMCDEVQSVATCLGIEDIKEVAGIWEDHGDDPSAFISHRSFRSNLPQSCYNDDLRSYHGDFPTDRGTTDDLQQTCSFELHTRFREGKPVLDVRQRIRSSGDAPPWLMSDKQLDVFNQLQASGDLAGAWMSLCSSGWNYGDAKQALLSLAGTVNDRRLKVLAENWCSLPFSDDARY